MNTKTCIETLSRHGDIPDDSEVVSTNNKVVVISRKMNIVARIGDLADLKSRDDPQDLRYSHRVAWLAGDHAPAVKPLHEHPILKEGYVISNYPLLNSNVDLDESQPQNIYDMTDSFSGTLSIIESDMTLRQLAISEYVQERLNQMYDSAAYDGELVDYVSAQIEQMNRMYPFVQLIDSDKALIHGDLKADNIVADNAGTLKFIDLDAAAIGPRLYDLSSWRLRSEMGDNAPVEKVVDIGRKAKGWNEDSYRALIGWKAISSMSFTLRYEAPELSRKKFTTIANAAITLGGLTKLPVNGGAAQ